MRWCRSCAAQGRPSSSTNQTIPPSANMKTSENYLERNLFGVTGHADYWFFDAQRMRGPYYLQILFRGEFWTLLSFLIRYCFSCVSIQDFLLFESSPSIADWTASRVLCNFAISSVRFSLIVSKDFSSFNWSRINAILALISFCSFFKITNLKSLYEKLSAQSEFVGELTLEGDTPERDMSGSFKRSLLLDETVDPGSEFCRYRTNVLLSGLRFGANIWFSRSMLCLRFLFGNSGWSWSELPGEGSPPSPKVSFSLSRRVSFPKVSKFTSR